MTRSLGCPCDFESLSSFNIPKLFLFESTCLHNARDFRQGLCSGMLKACFPELEADICLSNRSELLFLKFKVGLLAP